VNAYGIPHSSTLAYLLPTETFEVSTFDEIPAAVKIFLISKVFSLKAG
jgi:hypothetical protein